MYVQCIIEVAQIRAIVSRDVDQTVLCPYGLLFTQGPYIFSSLCVNAILPLQQMLEYHEYIMYMS